MPQIRLSEAARSSLAACLTEGQLLTSPLEMIPYEIDAGLDRGAPDAVAFPRRTEELEQLMRWAAAHQIPIVARGAGTGLSGGAVAEHGGLIISCTSMRRVLSLDAAGRSARVEPGVVNQAFDALVRQQGLYFPPDPSSGRSSTIGGNIGENSGGPHCFKYGVTTNYVTGLDVVLADGSRVQLGGIAFDYPEYDLTGLVTGSEGTLALIGAADLRLIRMPPAVKTLMVAFSSVERAGQAVSAIIAAGLVPATLEMMDQNMMRIIEDFTHVGLPIQAGAALIIETDGHAPSAASQIDAIVPILHAYDAFDLRIAATAQERDLIWYGRKNAAGALSRLAPAYYLVDITVPRSRLAQTLGMISQICAELELRVGYVFHAGDGNLHPLLLIEHPNDPECIRRVHVAGARIVELAISFDGSITGEHGVGIEKREYMPLMYSADELDVMCEIRDIFDPQHLLNPGKIFPQQGTGSGEQVGRMAETQAIRSITHDLASLPCTSPTTSAEAASMLNSLRRQGKPVSIRGAGTKMQGQTNGEATISTENLLGVMVYARDDLYVTVGAGTPLEALQAALANDRMWVPLGSPWPNATLGGIISSNWHAPLRMRYGSIRDLVLALTVVLPDGRVIRAGRPVVKNVAGYDMPKLFIGAQGTLGLITEATLKLAPIPAVRSSLVIPISDRQQGLSLGMRLLPVCMHSSALVLTHSAVLPDIAQSSAYVLIATVEGNAQDVEVELGEMQAVLRQAGVFHATLTQAVDGTTVWGEWMRHVIADTSRPCMRYGVGISALPSLLGELDTNNPMLLDIGSGLLYTHAVGNASMQRKAEAMRGYAIGLSGDAQYATPWWGRGPGSRRIQRALREHFWGSEGP